MKIDGIPSTVNIDHKHDVDINVKGGIDAATTDHARELIEAATKGVVIILLVSATTRIAVMAASQAIYKVL